MPYLHLLDSYSIFYDYLRGERMSVARQKGVRRVHRSKALQGLVLVVGGYRGRGSQCYGSRHGGHLRRRPGCSGRAGCRYRCAAISSSLHVD